MNNEEYEILFNKTIEIYNQLIEEQDKSFRERMKLLDEIDKLYIEGLKLVIIFSATFFFLGYIVGALN